MDSLWTVFHDEHQTDSLRANAIHNITVKLAYTDPDSGLKAGDQYLHFVFDHKVIKAYAGAYNSIGTCYLNKGNLDSAQSNFEKGLYYRRLYKDKRGEAASLNNIGIVYYQRGAYSRCLEYYQQSLRIKDSLGDNAGVASSYSNIGMINEEQGNKKKALEYYWKSLMLRISIKDNRAISDSYQKLGGYYMKKESYDSAQLFIHESIHYSLLANDRRSLATNYLNLGQVFESKSEDDSALYYFQLALTMQHALHNEEGIAIAQKDLGSFYVSRGKDAAGIRMCDSALVLATATEYARTQMQACNCLAQGYDHLHQSGRALYYYKRADSLSDSLVGEETAKEIARKTLEYDFSMDKLEDSLRIQKDNELKDIRRDKEVQQQQFYTMLGAGAFVVMLIIAFIAFRGYRQKQQSNRELEKKNLLIEEKQKEILDSITYARRLQEAILPSMDTMRKFLQNGFVLYKPKDIVAGDFYWLEHVNGVTYVAAADCTGHGVPGAMVSVVCSAALNRCVLEFGITDPGKILDRARELVLETFSRSEADVKDGMDISLIALSDKDVKWAGANNPLWIFENAQLTAYKADKQPIGKTDNPKPFTTITVERRKGMRIYLLTDGFADQFGGPQGKKFKYKQIEKILSETFSLNMDAQRNVLDTAFIQWQGALEQVDDVCVIGIELS